MTKSAEADLLLRLRDFIHIGHSHYTIEVSRVQPLTAGIGRCPTHLTIRSVLRGIGMDILSLQ